MPPRVDVAILGAGNGGLAAAADLGLRGFTCALTNRSADRLEPLRQRGGVESSGATGDVFVPIARITPDLPAAVEDADIIMLTVPASGQEFYSRALAPLVRPRQLIVLNASNTGSALHVARLLAEGGAPPVTIVELNSLTYICRLASPTRINISGRARTARAAVLPATERESGFAGFRRLYPQADLVESVLATSLTNFNAVLHPPGMLLNAGWIEHTAGDFLYYYEGTTPAVARAIEAVDGDRLRVAAAYGIATGSFLDFFHAAGYTSERAWAAGSVFEAMKDSVPNRYIKAQPNLEGRYITEDIAFGLVPLRVFAAAAGVATPTVEAFIHLASVATGVDYDESGLTAARLGLEGADRSEVLNLVERGPWGIGR